MSQGLVIVRCTKDLYMKDGPRSFTKGRHYIAYRLGLDGGVEADDQGERHGFGLWHKHFKVVK